MVAINVLKGGSSLLRSCGGGGRPLLPTHCRRFNGNGNRVGKWEMTVGGSPLHLSPNSISLPNNTKSKSTATESASRVFCCKAFQNAAVDSFSSSPLPETPSSSPSESDDHLVMIKNAANTLDIRVGRIVRAWRHEEADSLFVEEVDIGEPQPRIICSGLVNYIPLDHLQDKMIVVLANLKPRNMRGVKSFGMLLAASDASHENIELLVPPEGSFPGERIWFGSTDEKVNLPDTATPNQIQKKKIWELVQPYLKTDTSCVAALGMHFMRTSVGVVTCRSLKNAKIS